MRSERRIGTLLLVLLGASSVSAQEPGDGLLQIPSLEAVVVRAVEQSPRVRGQEALTRKNEHLLDRARRTWTDNITIGGQALYGSYGNDILNTTNLGITAGVSIRMSIFDLVGRRSDIASWTEEVNFSRVREAELRLEERQYVIDLYSRLTLARRLVVVRSEAWQAACAHQQMADAQFGTGDIPIAELARVTEIAAKARSDYETARSEYLNAYQKLESLVGMPLDELAAEQ